MKSKASLLLMEQLVMLLVFALAAALCLGIFVRADRISHQNRQRDEAVRIARNVAEVLKSTGDADRALAAAGETGYNLSVTAVDSGIEGLKQATVAVSREEGVSFSLDVAWQEVAE